jgi:hypothetical protein
MKRLNLYNFLYILYLTYIYYKTDLRRLFIILRIILSYLLCLKDHSIESVF